jgi:hypothetical protein
MTSPEFIGARPPGRELAAHELASGMGELALVPQASLVEWLRSPKGKERPIPVINKTSCRTYQDTSELFSQRIFVHGWSGICAYVDRVGNTAGTRASSSQSELPNWMRHVYHDKKGRITGFAPEAFADIAREAVARHGTIEGFGCASAQFLTGMTERLQGELRPTAANEPN